VARVSIQIRVHVVVTIAFGMAVASEFRFSPGDESIKCFNVVGLDSQSTGEGLALTELSTDAGSCLDEFESIPDEREYLDTNWIVGKRAVFSPSETLVFLDWDDTLLPSTWLSHEGLNLDSSCEVSDKQRQKLRMIANSAARTLALAKKFGKTIIITNAEAGWVEQTSAKFIEEVAPQLQDVSIVSARTLYEPRGASPYDWKRLAFQEEVDQFFKGRPAHHRRNIISVGDAAYERDALFAAARGVVNCRAKCLKLEECPELDDLVDEHAILSAHLHDVVECDRNVDLLVAAPRMLRKMMPTACYGWMCMG